MAAGSLTNYHNYDDHSTSVIQGRIVDDSGNPVKDAVVLAWDQYWLRSHHTVTKSDGSFELKGPFYFYHWMASAVGHTMIRDDVRPNSARTGIDGIPRMDLGTLKISRGV